ncbi:hypothetical protein [Cognaticolwellia beringensis]|uniref:Secreted protein n=1 Tax=Cognaticolwellia beringensis TaxID=1967665 RepID=A0A222G4B5_9GAMM|nr:hypothetical protein [Cognaticolwellia beringensis]ASP46755.1 hypothetical protein B5D82_02530 [Cognaticolwellia beringensis]
MKKLILALAVLALTSNAAFSQDDEPELMAASPEYVLSLLAQCKNDAVEDEITKSEMNSYLLTCINDELEASYYEAIKVLPKEG